MAYEIYLSDTVTGTAIALDSLEDLDFSTQFAIADVKDLLTRRDVITKNLSFKFSPVNNRAFGFAMMGSKYINEADNTPILGGNYNPQISVPCSIYENGILILKGNLRLKTVTQNQYKCVVTGSVKEFTTEIGDSLLTDLDLSDLSHSFTLQTIQDSWMGVQDYVYPAIQYGVKFKNPNLGNSYVNPFNILNFKPAIFVKAIFDRIFDDIGFSYQVKGDAQFIEVFNKLIVPNNSKTNVTANVFNTGTTRALTLLKTQNDTWNDAALVPGNVHALPIRMDSITDTLNLMSVAPSFGFTNVDSIKRANTIFNIDQEFTATALLTYQFGYNNSNSGSDLIDMHIDICTRNTVPISDGNGYNTFDGWDVYASDTFRVGSGNGAKTGSVAIPSNTFTVGKQLLLRMTFTNAAGSPSYNGTIFNYTLSACQLTFPNLPSQSIDVTVGSGSTIVPTLPTGVKQLDFINSICSIFNLYKYVNPDNETQIIFEPYNSYYSGATEGNLIDNAIDWTEYVDWSGDYTDDSNLDIPKNYNFKWKDDSKDYFLNYYQSKYNKTYADLQVTDSRGITDKKEISIIFSPTIITGGYNTSNTPYFGLAAPYIFGVSGSEFEPIDSNIRILIWNGVTTSAIGSANNFSIITESYDANSATWNRSAVVSNTFPVASNYLLDSNKNPIFDIHTGRPNELFITQPTGFSNIEYSYKYYADQIKELKSGNITFLTCQMYLPVNEISNLDLKKPIFLDRGRNGYSYYKLLSVDYTNSLTRSTVKFQKII